MAGLVGLGDSIVDRAREHVNTLTSLAARDDDDEERKQKIKRRKEIYRITAQLKQIAETSELSEVELGKQLVKLQTATIKYMHGTFATKEE